MGASNRPPETTVCGKPLATVSPLIVTPNDTKELNTIAPVESVSPLIVAPAPSMISPPDKTVMPLAVALFAMSSTPPLETTVPLAELKMY